MELRQLRHFLAVVETGSYARAAEAVGLTPQALSKSIAALEDSVGVRLLDRTSRHVAMTPYGELLFTHATAISAEASQFMRHLDDILGVKSGRLVVGTGPTSVAALVAPAVQRLRKLLPRLRITVLGGSTANLLPMLLRGEIDVLTCLLNDVIEDPLIEQTTLATERLVFLAGPRHPLAARPRVAPSELLAFPWLVGWNEGRVDQRAVRAFAARGLELPAPDLHTTSEMFAREILCDDRHLALLPEGLFSRDIRAGLISRLDVDVEMEAWARPVKLLYRRKSTRSPAAMAFITALNRVREDNEADPVEPHGSA